MIRFERMKAEERSICSEVAVQAFADYEYFSIYVPDNEKRLRFLRSMLKSEIILNDGPAEFYTAKEEGKIVAVAMLCRPDYRKPSDMAYMKAGFWKCFLQGGIRNVAAWNKMEAGAIAPCHSLAGITWYLNLLTVTPEKAGGGIGSQMLHQCILPVVKNRGGETLCLFTNSQINRKFYLKNGFEEFDAQTFRYKSKTIGSWSYRISVNNFYLKSQAEYVCPRRLSGKNNSEYGV
ncbi:MAG: GNAT family N-acetyltransferase [Blautia sp.]|nr:GNAT family N-acetyltransferase [Blautia sp.]